MPSASAQTEAAMERLFGLDTSGDPLLGWDQRAMSFLRDAGYVLTRGFEWLPKPGIREWSEMTDDERICMRYLFEEWDFGGLVTSREPTDEPR